MHITRSSLLTKLLILILLIAVLTALIKINGQLDQLLGQVEREKREVAIQTQANAGLADAIERSGDPGQIEDVARDKLGLVKQGEIIFIPMGDMGD